MRKDGSDRRVRLVCVPYAGASALMYRSWHTELDDLVRLHAVSLPSRAEFSHFQPRYDLHEVAEALTDEVARTDYEIALFGYSLGVLLGFEVARRLVARGRPPLLLIVAACAPPNVPPTCRDRHALPDTVLVDWLRTQGASTEDVLSDAAMVALLLPILRSDIALVDGYHYRSGPPLPTPIVAIGGRDYCGADPATMTGWAAQSELPLTEVRLEGGHLFIAHQENAVINVVRDALEAVTAVTGRRSR